VGLEVPELSSDTRAKLAAFLPPEASLSNPVDMIASAGPDAYRRTVATLLAAPEVDAMVVIYIPVGLAETDAIAQAVREGVREGRANGGEGKPVYACFMTERGQRVSLSFPEETIPSYRFPESAARSLGHVARYAQWRSRPLGMVPDFEDINPERAQRAIRQFLQEHGPGWLSPEVVQEVLRAFSM